MDDGLKMKWLEKNNHPEWDEFVESSPQGSIYSKTFYLKAVGMPYRLLAVVENDRIQAGIVIIRNRVKLYSNPLLCKYLGIMFCDMEGSEYASESRRRRICEVLIPELSKYTSFNYAFHHRFSNYLSLYWSGFRATTMYTYIIDLAGRSEEDILADMHSKQRSELKYAAKQDYEILDDMKFDDFFQVNAETYRRQGGSPPFKKDYLRHYVESLKLTGNVRLMGIASGGEKMAVAGIIYDSRTTSLILSGFDPEKMQRGANEMLIWETIRFASTVSAAYDFEGSMIAPIDSFYRKFGGAHTAYERIFRDNLLNFAAQKGRQWFKKFKYGK